MVPSALLLVAVSATSFAAPPSHSPDFTRDVRPILSDFCFRCHGPDASQRKGKLRLDRREDALKGGDGGPALRPGHPDESEILARVVSDDELERMPPPEVKKRLNAAQIDILRRWVASGAEYREHWAFQPPRRVDPLTLRDDLWARDPIDRFIAARLDKEGLRPSPEADRATLIRRVTLDLTGLPPTPEAVDAFVADPRPGAYERVVDRLLASPHFGERLAVDWLDAARFADSNGYQVDRDREAHPWRDWVIAAFNRNLPFDQFTVEQLAGDLLPNPTLDQRIATGFHRNHMLNEEGGIIPEEFLAEYTADRVETTAAVWLGLTFNCARCHDHKYDPVTQRDFYGMKAFFHNVPERGVGNYGIDIRHNAPPFLRLPDPAGEAKLAKLKQELAAVTAAEELRIREVAEAPSAIALSLAYAIAPEGPPAETLAIAGMAAAARPQPKARTLAEFVLSKGADFRPLLERKKKLAAEADQAEKALPTALVMEEMPEPRPTFVLVRGAYDRPGERVTAATPGALPALDPALPKNRLGLARWLVDPRHPLTARVAVNRFWQTIFGTGLVRTSEDFGAQGEPPSHPELLDSLSLDFVESGWDVKGLLRRIVTSATYRQSSRLAPQLAQRDPENRLLARGPRFRLQAEFVRDQALAVSGLLVRRLGGPSVRPYHPPGLYEQVTAGSGRDVYVQGAGDELFRRSMYTYWKRSVPNPAMLLFDAPFREACTLRRPRTNTPLQALNLLNDPTYVEAARGLATRALREGGPEPSSRIKRAFRLALGRSPGEAEVAILVRAFQRAETGFRADLPAATELLAVGTTPVDPKLDRAELAALTTVTATILNLDETLTKE